MRKIPNCPVLAKMRELETAELMRRIVAGEIGERVTAGDIAARLGWTNKRAAMALESCGYLLRRSSSGRFYVRE